MTTDGELGRFDASVASLAPIRRLVGESVAGLGHHDLVDDAVLCASELASNAILHTRLPFDVEVDEVPDGVRVVIRDRRPSELPAVVPSTGLARDITSQGTTGRGLQIVASVADRWGVTTDEATKAVWVELRPDSDKRGSAPVIVDAHRAPIDDHDVTLHLHSLPVRAAVASGMHLDGLVRELQLDPGRVDQAEMQRLYRLLDESAPVRLEGRRLALVAASRDEERYDLTIRASRPALTALGEVDRLVTSLVHDRLRAPFPPGVVALRAWLREEALRQLRGLDPTTCLLP